MNVDEFCATLEEFFSVLAHAIFYIRGIYPRNTFNHVRQYDTATYQSNHPGVAKWCENAAQLCVRAIRSNRCQSVSFIVLQDGQAADRFVIDTRHISSALKMAVHPQDLQDQYRATLVSLYQKIECDLATNAPVSRSSGATSGASASAVPHLSMTVAVSGTGLSQEADSPWVIGSTASKVPGTRRVQPIRFIEAGALSLGFYYIENK